MAHAFTLTKVEPEPWRGLTGSWPRRPGSSWDQAAGKSGQPAPLLRLSQQALGRGPGPGWANKLGDPHRGAPILGRKVRSGKARPWPGL